MQRRTFSIPCTPDTCDAFKSFISKKSHSRTLTPDNCEPNAIVQSKWNQDGSGQPIHTLEASTSVYNHLLRPQSPMLRMMFKNSSKKSVAKSSCSCSNSEHSLKSTNSQENRYITRVISKPSSVVRVLVL